MNSTSSRFRMGPAVPTAARAVSPIYLPTTMESTVLYSCWARLPISSGTENLISPRMGLPWVMSCTPKKVLIRDATVIRNVLFCSVSHFLL